MSGSEVGGEAPTVDSFLVKVDPNGGEPFRAQIVWKNLLGFLVLHAMAVYGIYLLIFEAKFFTFIWMLVNIFIINLGVGVGIHRLWTHRSYKANAGLRLFLTICFTTAGQNCIYTWARDHRQHHRHSDTAADPHDSTRGFFFSHVGWLLVRKHPAVIAAGKEIDMADLEADGFVMFQKKYYKTVYAIFAIALPVFVPWYCWGEDVYTSFYVSYILKYVITLNGTWCVNSVAHFYGMRPYNSKIVPVESKFSSILCGGEGWHNYHHTFPWDYRASELGMAWNFNASFIEWCARRGWVTHLRTANEEMVRKRVLRSGDGSHFRWGEGGDASIRGR